MGPLRLGLLELYSVGTLVKGKQNIVTEEKIKDGNVGHGKAFEECMLRKMYIYSYHELILFQKGLQR